MNKKTTLLLHISLAFGIVFILSGIVLLLASYASPENVSFSISSIVLLALGAVSLFLSLAITRRTFFLYLGLNLCFGGILSIILSFSLFNLTFHKIWPIGMIFSGVTLFPCGYFSFHKCKKSYIFPSVVLTLLGLLFSLFSFDVITESFSKIVTLWWPIALIVLGSVLITVFVIQKKNQASFPFINDDEELDYYVGSGDEL
ncbi:MAG: hypothetical protein K6A89_01410 [Treponema sp.]|nr:hypothetical protein [Treponema sp.]